MSDNDLEESVGENAMRKSLDKKRTKAREKLGTLMKEKVIPLQAEIAMYDEMIAAIDKREGIGILVTDVPEMKMAVEGPE